MQGAFRRRYSVTMPESASSMPFQSLSQTRSPCGWILLTLRGNRRFALAWKARIALSRNVQAVRESVQTRLCACKSVSRRCLDTTGPSFRPVACTSLRPGADRVTRRARLSGDLPRIGRLVVPERESPPPAPGACFGADNWNKWVAFPPTTFTLSEAMCLELSTPSPGPEFQDPTAQANTRSTDSLPTHLATP
jgi:hypothetical protein